MTTIGYQASQEQFSPSELLQYVKRAEAAGFDAVLSSDHIEPWSKSQGFSGFTWSWLGSALEATMLSYGVVTVSGYRYHPVILAQAVATLEEMYSNRFFLTMGSGEALNEHVIGGKWPIKQIRNEILKESGEVMRRLWKGEEVTHFGKITVEEAQLYIKLKAIPRIYGAALTEKTAEWLGSWADGMITTSRPLPDLKKILEAFYKGGGKGKPVVLKVQLSYDTSYENALEGAYDQWRNTLLPSTLLADIKTADQFDEAGKLVSKEMVKQHVKVSADTQEIVEWVKDLQSLGFEKIILHNVNRNQEQFITDFGKSVLPFVKKS